MFPSGILSFYYFTEEWTYEKNLPTEQTPSQKDDRLPRPHENHLRAKADQPPPQSWPQSLERINGPIDVTKFPKSARLRKGREFKEMVKKGERRVGRYLCVDYRPARALRLGISASTRFGSSPERNRFKRIVREAFRTLLLPHSPPLSCEINVLPRQKAKGATLRQVGEELLSLLQGPSP